MYHHRPRHSRRHKSVSDYLMPFLLIVCVGVILVLLVNLWQMFFGAGEQKDGYLHISSGEIDIKTWGTDDFFTLNSDTVIMQGDEIKTSSDANVIVEFADGTIMRAAENTNVVFEEFDADADEPHVSILLVSGKVWFNKVYRETDATQVEVTMDNVVVHATSGSIFEVENDFEEVARVLYGDEVVVDVLTAEDDKVVETQTVGIGQEAVFTDKVLERYWQYQSPNVLAALSDEFKTSAWYEWNIKEDKSPTKFFETADGEDVKFVKVSSEEVVDEETAIEDEETTVEGEEEEEVKEEVSSVIAPLLTAVANATGPNAQGYYSSSNSVVIISGTASGAEKIMVNDFVLQKFKAGDTKWSYYANADYGFMAEGENIYNIYAVDKDGKKSKPLTVKVVYKKQAAAPAPTPTPAPVVTPPAEETPAAEKPADGGVPTD